MHLIGAYLPAQGSPIRISSSLSPQPYSNSKALTPLTERNENRTPEQGRSPKSSHLYIIWQMVERTPQYTSISALISLPPSAYNDLLAKLSLDYAMNITEEMGMMHPRSDLPLLLALQAEGAASRRTPCSVTSQQGRKSPHGPHLFVPRQKILQQKHML